MTTQTKFLPETILHALEQFTGTENYYPHWTRRAVFTDGVKYLAETCGAYWLIDAIVSYQPVPKGEEFQVWTLSRNEKGAKLVCTDGNDAVLVTQEIEYTDFPLDEMKLYFIDRVLLLPSEY